MQRQENGVYFEFKFYEEIQAIWGKNNRALILKYLLFYMISCYTVF